MRVHPDIKVWMPDICATQKDKVNYLKKKVRIEGYKFNYSNHTKLLKCLRCKINLSDKNRMALVIRE